MTRWGRGIFALALLQACGCGGDEQMTGRVTGTGGNGFGNAGDPVGGDGDFGNPGGGSPGGGGVVGGGTGGLGGGLELNGSYIWIANSEQGTVSKIDTRTMEELGRYMANPNADGHPSRTSVGSTGAVVVANRGFGINFAGADGAGITKIEASEDLCTDRNSNGTIDTSTGANDIRPWMEDECISWWRPLPAYSNRPVSWAPPSGPDLPETVWTSTTQQGQCTDAACSFTVFRLNGATGDIEAEVPIGPLGGAGFLPFALIDYGVYGGAADAGGNFWGFVANTTHLFRVDALTLDVQTWPIPNANGYGITVDPKGRVFVCGAFGLSRFDPASQTWQETADTGISFNGCMTDGADKIWVGGAGLAAFDAETMAPLGRNPVGGGVKGVSVDFDGYVWGVGSDMNGTADRAFRLDPATGEFETFVGLTGAYSYSDMTGFGLTRAGYVPVDPQ